jgi:hypothetical protein
VKKEATMQTDDLIARLSENLAPTPKGQVGRLLLLGLVGGVAASTLLMWASLGLRPDLSVAMTGSAFWMKFSYVLAIGALGLWMVERQARAGAEARLPFMLLAVPVVALVLAAAAELSAPRADSAALIMGSSASVCAFLILMLALPIFAGLFLALRRLAPTRLTMAGAAAGLAAGGWSASIYSFHCTESTAPFIVIWYSLGMVLAAALGALLGRWVLRW